MSHQTALCLFFVLLVGWAKQGHGQALDKPIIECATHEFAPYIIVEEGEVSGIEADLLALIGDELNVSFEINIIPWARALEAARMDQIDCVFAAFRTPERETFLDYTEVPLHVSEMAIYTRQGADIQVRTMLDLKGMVIATVRGFVNSPKLEELSASGDVTLVEITEIDQTFDLLRKGRVDMVIYNKLVGDFYLSDADFVRVRPLSDVFAEVPSYVTFAKSRNHRELIKKFDAVLVRAFQDGRYKSIVEVYQKRYASQWSGSSQ